MLLHVVAPIMHQNVLQLMIECHVWKVCLRSYLITISVLETMIGLITFKDDFDRSQDQNSILKDRYATFIGDTVIMQRNALHHANGKTQATEVQKTRLRCEPKDGSSQRKIIICRLINTFQ